MQQLPGIRVRIGKGGENRESKTSLAQESTGSNEKRTGSIRRLGLPLRTRYGRRFGVHRLQRHRQELRPEDLPFSGGSPCQSANSAHAGQTRGGIAGGR